MKQLGFAVVVLALFLAVLATSPGEDQTAAVTRLHQDALKAVREGRNEEAMALYQRIIDLEPASPGWRRDLMWLAWQAEDYPAVIQAAEGLLQLSADDVEGNNLLGQGLQRTGRPREALAAFVASLRVEPDQPAIRLALVRTLEELREYGRALEEARTLAADHPDLDPVWPARARLEEIEGLFPAAAASWKMAVAAFPDDVEFRHRYATTLYAAGEQRTAIEELERLLRDHPGHAASREFLVDQALVANDLDRAIGVLESAPRGGRPDDLPTLGRLTELHLRRRDWTAALATANQALGIAPDDGTALLQRAECLRQLARYREAAADYEQALQQNPWNLAALVSLADTRMLQGYADRAVEIVRRARILDPTDPLLRLKESAYLAGADRLEESRQLLTAWLKQNDGPALPVLLYHGLTTRADDVLLASPVHMTTAVFASQMRALHDAEYVSVSASRVADWLNGDAELPPRAVLITFDDGRLDSFRQADPILERFGFEAVMFVPGINADRNLPGYASWDEMKRFQDTGRWDLQSHGDRASLHLPAQRPGRRSHFLANRAWLAEEHRWETRDEWDRRIQTEYRDASAMLAERGPTAPIAFSWPEGTFGQQGVPNVPDAAPRNLELVRAHFALGFRQDAAGINTRGRDPYLLSRLEPDADWDGETLIRYLKDQDPNRRHALQLVRIAQQAGDAEEGLRWLTALREGGLSEDLATVEEARIHLSAGDAARARGLIDALLAGPAAVPPAVRADALAVRGEAWFKDEQFAKARAAFEESLETQPDQLALEVRVAEAFEAERDFAAALDRLDRLRATHPSFPRVLPVMARIRERAGDLPGAREAWDAAAQVFAGNPDVQFQAARTDYLTGRVSGGLQAMQALLKEWPDHRRTREFQIQAWLVLDRPDKALQTLDGLPGAPNADRLLRTAHLYVRLDDYRNAEDRLREALTLDPDHGEALLLLAKVLRLAGRPLESAQVYDAIVQRNPHSFPGWLGLVDAALAADQPDRALAAIGRARKLDPTDPYFLLREADALFAGGHHDAADALLGGWLETTHEPVLPILLYHGLTPRESDPLLASRIHFTTRTFERQLTALRDRGYTTVNVADVAAWQAGRKELPDKPILIAFDDGRLDSFREADPILERLGFQAVMFVAAANADRNLPDYASWDEIRRYAETGRWDIQSHGDLASAKVPVNQAGRAEIYLAHRMMTEDGDRIETEAEWLARIEEEYRRGKARIIEEVGVSPIGFAWPEGEFGQQGVPNVDRAAERNLALTEATYALAFYQDTHGMNLRSRDPIRMTRFEPPQDWTGEDLLRHLADENPYVKYSYHRLRHAAWRGRLRDGVDRLDDMERAGASPEGLQVAEALLRFSAGDVAGARGAVDRALGGVSFADAASLASSIEERQRPRMIGSFRWWEDDDDRRNLIFSLDGEMNLRATTRLFVETTLANYEDDVADVDEFAVELAAEEQLNERHALRVGLGGHSFSEDADSMVSFAGRWTASWTPLVRTVAEVERQPLYTAEALREDLDVTQLRLHARWIPANAWQLDWHGRYWDISDGNHRVSTSVEGRYRVQSARPGLSLVGRLSYDDSDRDAEAYYAPLELAQVQAGFDYRSTLHDDAAWQFKYLPGYGKESGEDARFVHALFGGLSYRPTPHLRLEPLVSYHQSPTYRSTSVVLSAGYQF